MPITERGQQLNVWMIVFTCLTTATFVGRAFAFGLQKRKLRGDDFLITISFASLMAMQVSTWITIPRNLGAHAEELSPEDASFQHRIQFSSGITWTIATVTCKMAVLWMYTHIFPPSGVRLAVWITMGFSAAFAVVFIPIFMTACSPPSAAWALDPMVAFAKCHPIQRQEFASVGANMVLDLAVVIVPMPMVWKLQLAMKKKIMVISLFSLGLGVVGVSAWRVYTTVESTKTMDWSYILLTTALQSHLELWLGILAANLPMMSPIFTRLLSPALAGWIRSVKSTWASKSLSKGTSSGESMESTIRVRKDFAQLSENHEGSVDDWEMSTHGDVMWTETDVQTDVQALTDKSPHLVRTELSPV